MSNRRPYPGETHTRGSDLPDGDLTEETFYKIIHKILDTESLTLSKNMLEIANTSGSG